MGLFDSLCRFCTIELDRAKSIDIFDSANSRLLKTAQFCIPVTVSQVASVMNRPEFQI